MGTLVLFQPIIYAARIVFRNENIFIRRKTLFVVGEVSRFGLDYDGSGSVVRPAWGTLDPPTRVQIPAGAPPLSFKLTYIDV